MRYLIATDTGGTFTDLAVYDADTGATHFGKTLTHYTDLVAGVIEGLSDTRADLAQAAFLKHGTTHVINAFVQRNGARTALVTTAGFRDLLEIGRGNRATPFDLAYRRLPPLVERRLRFEVAERIDGSGQVVTVLDEDGVRRIADSLRQEKVEAVAISFLNAFSNPVHEQRAEQLLREALPQVFICTGTSLTREWSEFERTSTAVANAYVGPRMNHYVTGFRDRLRARDFPGSLYMMGSNGGVMAIDQAVAQPIALLESGPIGGCIGAGAYALALDLPKLIAFDMGGTTAKCALVENGNFDVQSTYYVGGYEKGFPIRTPVLDIVEVGAGGGSIAWLDDNGRLNLGPRSAGSEPGPIAFGRGGTEPTVTDANVALGRIGSDSFMNGKLLLDVDAARSAIEKTLSAPLGYHDAGGVDRVAQGILDLANVKMTSAIKEITVDRGRDTRDYALFVFGGGGPLFGADLARALGIHEVIVPPQPGAFSCLGMLMAEARTDLAQTFVISLADEELGAAAQVLGALEREARAEMAKDFDVSQIAYEHKAEMRYRGQKHTVRVDLGRTLRAEEIRRSFEDVYVRRYGHLNHETAIEFISLHVGALVPTSKPDLQQVGQGGGPAPTARTHRPVYFGTLGTRLDTPIYRREDLPTGFACDGPLVIEEYTSTTLVGPDDHVVVGALGELHITCAPTQRAGESS